MRCHVCVTQGRKEDLLELHYFCPKCQHHFCPHHSSNPRRLGDVFLRTFYNEVDSRELTVSWRHWDGSVKRERFDAAYFCLLCTKDDRILEACEFLSVQDEYIKQRSSQSRSR